MLACDRESKTVFHTRLEYAILTKAKWQWKKRYTRSGGTVIPVISGCCEKDSPYPMNKEAVSVP